MPVKSLFIFLFFIATANCLCAQGYPGARRLTCRQENITFDNFFRIVYEQTGMTAFYNDDQLNSYDKVSVNFKNERLDDVLARLLRKRGMAWCYRKEVLVIADKREGDVDLGYLPGEDKRIITGVVVNEKGAPLDAVAVMTADRLTGMSTEKDGKFFLRDVAPNANLLVQRTGYKPMVLASFADSIYIQMIPMIAPLQEVNVTGVVQGMLTGSVSQVKSKEIAESPVNNVLGALQGRVPGLYINQTTGLPGGGYRIRLRGKNSIESNSDPLILVDGVPFPSVSFNENFFNMSGTTGANVAPSPLNLLSVNDIESIQILKDADATAMYGTRGANGVILINSKAPNESGKWIAGTANVYRGLGKASNLLHYLNTAQYLEMRREAFKNDGIEPDAVNAPDLQKWNTVNEYTDWQKVMIGGTANITDASVELKGGRRNFGYRASGLYRQESTVYPSADFQYKKRGAMLQLRYNSKDEKLRMGLSANYVADQNYLPTTDLTTLSTTAPNTPNVYKGKNLNFADGTFDNPYAYLLQTSRAKSSNFRTLLNTSWQPRKDLIFSVDLGGSSVNIKEVQITPGRSLVGPDTVIKSGTSHFYTNRFVNGLVDVRGSWRKTIGQEQFWLIAGARAQFEGQLKMSHRVMEYTGDDASMENITAGGPIEKMDSIRSDFQNQSFYSRLEYKHADKYIATLTYNRDGSSRLIRSYGNFGAIGAAWVFSREGWFIKNNLLSFGKLRASYGVTGNDRYERSSNKADYIWGIPFSYRGIQEGNLGYIPSKPRGWEKIRKMEVALDLGLVNDRILVTLCYYNNKSTDLLLTGRLPDSIRSASTVKLRDAAKEDIYMALNVPAIVINRGFELDLEGVVVRGSKLTWSTNLNISIPKNRLVYMPDLEVSGYKNAYTEGMSLDMIKGFHFKGVNRETGVYDLEDLTGNGPSLDDRNFGKELGPFLYGGWYNHIRYSNLEISFLFRYTKQNNYSYQYSPVAIPPGAMRNQPTRVMDRWREPGNVAPMQRFTTDPGTDPGFYYALALESDQQLAVANYLRLQSLSLAYNFPQKWLMKTKVKSCKLYVQGLNLFTSTKYEGRDPEVSAGPDSYPSLRVLTAGMTVSF